MPRALSKVAPDWWDYTTLAEDLLDDAATLSVRDLQQLARPGFQVKIYDTREEFFLAEALEYIACWRQSTADNPAGLCGPIGPTEQLPLVARIVNDLNLDLREGVFWGMDEWVVGGREAPPTLALLAALLASALVGATGHVGGTMVHNPPPPAAESDAGER